VIAATAEDLARALALPAAEAKGRHVQHALLKRLKEIVASISTPTQRLRYAPGCREPG
jgi:hypothetical protein